MEDEHLYSVASKELVARLSTIIDDIMLSSELNFESINYESTRNLAVLSMVQKYAELKKESQTQVELDEALIATMSYMMIENVILWVEFNKSKGK